MKPFMAFGEELKRLGVVGAGGAGFPTYVKAESRVECVIANGAECEPLVHKDVELMARYPGEILGGLRRMAEATGARQTKFGIKEKNARAIEAVRGCAGAGGVEMVLLGDFYPSGDEFELVYSATGRLIPPAGLPLQVGCVVNNVETLYNVERAAGGVPVTEKFLSVVGAVNRPQSFWAPVGVSFRELIEAAGGASVNEFALFVSGLMMGSFTRDLDDVVTKTTGALIVLPVDHYLVKRRERTQAQMMHIGKSACDQCSYCTELCPRYLLGYEVMPHKVMRGLGFTASGGQNWNQWAQLCCGCGICTLYACPEDLYPKEACDQARKDLRAAGIKFTQQKPPALHPMKDYRRVPLDMLRRRLEVERYETAAPFAEVRMEPARVRIKLLQHAGRPARAAVAAGQKVTAGEAVGRVEAGELGADVHASIAGTVAALTDEYVEIAR